MPVLLGALFILDAFTSLFTQTKGGTFERASSPLLCLGVSSLCLALFSNFLISDVRKWSATRTVRLRIYQEGLIYESKGQVEACRWNEIKDITYRVIEVHSKYSAPKRVRVIRSIVKRDGEIISLAETLSLLKITQLINTARNEYPKQMRT